MFFAHLIDALQANAVLIGLLVGAVTPPIISLVQQPGWTKQTRMIVSMGFALAIGFAVAGANGQLDPANLLPTIIAVWTAGEAFYQKVWKAIGVTQAVENATTLPSHKLSDDDFALLLEDPYEEDYGDEPEGLEHK